MKPEKNYKDKWMPIICKQFTLIMPVAKNT